MEQNRLLLLTILARQLTCNPSYQVNMTNPQFGGTEVTKVGMNGLLAYSRFRFLLNVLHQHSYPKRLKQIQIMF